MMTHKIVISNSKQANDGKTTSIRYVFECLKERYNWRLLRGYTSSMDFEAIVEIPQADGHIVKVGIESLGDPGAAYKSPQVEKSIKTFLKEGCEIILVATRLKGATIKEVKILRDVHHWQVIWFDNSTMKFSPYNKVDASGTKLDHEKPDKQLQDQLSRDYGFYVASLIERLVLTGGVI